MKRTALLVALAAATRGFPCCIVSDGANVTMTGENALIVWDEKNKTEHFVRMVDFDTDAATFGFIVPTASVPDMAVVEDAALQAVTNFVHRKSRPVSLGCSAESGTVASAGSVEVIKQEKLGDYDATVVKATDGSSLNKWLRDHGFVSRPAMTSWLQYYAEKGWAFTALKYTGVKGEPSKTRAIRFSFKADKPHFPWKMPSDTFPAGWVRPVHLSLVSNEKMAGKLTNGKYWSADTEWSGECDEIIGVLLADLNLAQIDFAGKPVLTSFTNDSANDGFDVDLAFEPDHRPSPATVGGAAIAAIAVGAVLRRRRRRAMRA